TGVLGKYLFNYTPESFYDELAVKLTPSGIEEQVVGLRAALQAPLDLRTARWIKRDPLGFARAAGRALATAYSGRGSSGTGGYISSADGKALLLMVRPTHNAFDIAFTTRFMQQVREAERATHTAAGDGVHVGYTGSYAFALEDAGTIKTDVLRYTALALIGILAVFFAGYRDLRILPFVTYPLLVSTGLSFLASLLFYSQLNAVSLSFAAILYGLSIDSGIHYYTRLRQEMRDDGVRSGVLRTLRALGGANVVACGTTAAAFFVIGFSGLVGISQLGFLTAIGMLVSIVEFFTLYPALSFALSERSLAQQPLETPRLGRLAAASARNAGAVLIAAALTGVALLAQVRDVSFDVDLTHLRPAATEAGRVQDEIATLFGSEASAGAFLVSGATLEAALRGSEDLNTRLKIAEDEGKVNAFHSVAALLPSERTQNQRLSRLEALPRAQATELLRAALESHGFRSAAFDDFFARWNDPPQALVHLGDAALEPFAAVIGHFVRQHDGAYTVAVYAEPANGHDLNSIADDLHRALPAVSFIAAGRGLLETALDQLLRRELVWFCISAFVLNLIMVLLNFRHPGLATAIMIPELLVILVFLFVAQTWGHGIDPVNLIVVPLILGIGVDNCVYVAARYQQGEAIGDALRNGGRALSVAALTTMAGFGFLGLSRYPALAGMGSLAALSLFLCLVASMTLLPALFRFLAQRNDHAD
ncbi:MAG TPA: MMPL family transporter, partial [Candidatus Acidoferrales bacterium]|nr:MMPL family transporter [Candidatus Acidoferrales bacterium]